jgi:hypothetical protein
MNQLFRKINELESIYLEALNTFSDGLYFPGAVNKISGQIIREKEGQDKHRYWFGPFFKQKRKKKSHTHQVANNI